MEENPELSQKPLFPMGKIPCPQRQGLTHLGHLGIPGSPTSVSSSPAHKPFSKEHSPRRAAGTTVRQPRQPPGETCSAENLLGKEPRGLPPPPPPPGEQREGETVLWSSGTGFCSAGCRAAQMCSVLTDTHAALPTSPAPCRPPLSPLVPPRRAEVS